MYQIIKTSRIWLSLSGLLVAFSIVALAVWHLNFGIDFTGGSLLEVEFNDSRPATSQVYDKLANLNLGSLMVQPIGDKGMILRFQDTSEEKHQAALLELDSLVGGRGSAASSTGETAATSTAAEASSGNAGLVGLTEMRFDSVGPSIGQELKSRSVTAIFVVLIAIIVYIAWAFRKVSKPVASWKYGLAAIVALFHDVLITLGVFSVLGAFFGVEINSAFVAAILTVLGYSVNDTIVVFDRIRENLPKSEEDFAGTVNISVNQTIGRSINTSLTTLIVLLSILFFGGSTIRDFVLALSIGVFVGTYSSIFIASPLLVIWEKYRKV